MNFLEPVDLTVNPVAAAQFTQQPIQPLLLGRNDYTGDLLAGSLAILLLISYIGSGLWYRKYRQQRFNTRIQQIQTLERIWNLPFHR